MASQSTNEIDEQTTQDENKKETSEEATNEDHLQRKRSRVGSHPDEESDTKITNEKSNEIVDETLSTTIENHETSDCNPTKNITGPIKRRKLNVATEEIPDQDENTNDSIQSATTITTTSESKDESSPATTTDDDDDETKDEDDTNEGINLPPTTNIYLRLRQRELGIFHRAKDRTTSRAFHNNMIASRNLVQRMKVSHTLDGHNGCVNALAFNRTGK
jgi:hypothetical protein